MSKHIRLSICVTEDVDLLSPSVKHGLAKYVTCRRVLRVLAHVYRGFKHIMVTYGQHTAPSCAVLVAAGAGEIRSPIETIIRCGIS